ncbi:MAG: hypothetical protein VX424_12910, partial [Actinomycetota bacterium]|nr:hypothetical protein [Actinomycetota bacterium]
LRFFFEVPLLTTLGVVLLVFGVVLWIVGSVGRPVAGRRYGYSRLRPRAQRGAPGPPRDPFHRTRIGSA